MPGGFAMFYVSAFLAVAGTVLYHILIRQVSGTVNPVISIAAVYAGALGLSAVLLPVFVPRGEILANLRQLNWVQPALACAVFLVELGFLLMYRSGWALSLANVVTGIFINLMLIGIGLFLAGERASALNAAGALLCVAGVAMIGHRPAKAPLSVPAPASARLVQAVAPRWIR